MPNPLLQVSGDDGLGGLPTRMHADYFFAAQDQFSRAVDLTKTERFGQRGDGLYNGGYSESLPADRASERRPTPWSSTPRGAVPAACSPSAERHRQLLQLAETPT